MSVKTKIGIVVAISGDKTAKVKLERIVKVAKYDKHEKKHSFFLCDFGDFKDVQVGEKVEIVECSPISKKKTKKIVNKLTNKSND